MASKAMARRAKAKQSRVKSGIIENVVMALQQSRPLLVFSMVVSFLIGVLLARWGIHWVAVLLAGVFLFFQTYGRGERDQPATLLGKQNNYRAMLGLSAVMVALALSQLIQFSK